jgi:MFS family permease
MFFVGYILLEVIWNVILKRIGPKIWLPSTTLAFGIVATLQGVVQKQNGVAGFLIVRFFLGVAEGALFPGVVFYLSMWYKRSERQFRIALFFAMASLAGAFGGILAYGIGHMRGVGGYNGWRWVRSDPSMNATDASFEVWLLTYDADFHPRRPVDLYRGCGSLLVRCRLAEQGEVRYRRRESIHQCTLEE